jgi:NAD(P)-dependent dehydrogenase (short-subunit alcohol dehydrogenase family)
VSQAPVKGSVVVTGVGSGIGFETARCLLAQNYRVLGIDRSRGRFDELRDGEKLFIEADVRDFDAQQRAIEGEAADSSLVGLVACAGILERRNYLDLDEETFDRHLDINLKGPFFACQAALPSMRRQRRGSIVLISSSIARTGSVAGAHYAASKGGILGLARTLALETARDGVRVNVVSPGVTDTPMPRGHASDQELYAKAAKIPLGRIGAPQDIAEAIAFLLSDDSSYITGQDIRVTGGAGLF